MTGRLAGKVAIIAGAGSVGPGWGNGRAEAVIFAQEGARVFLVDRDLAALEETVGHVEAAGGKAHTYQCDVTSDTDVETMVATCADALGSVDILVNNVGGSRAGGVAELSPEDWAAQFNYNLNSVFLACRHAVPRMIEQGTGGSIINTASASGMRWTGAAQIGYASAKAAVIQFS